MELEDLEIKIKITAKAQKHKENLSVFVAKIKI
jgi:hypothetical protein